MSNLRFSDSDLDRMASRPNISAMRIGRTQPYHLTYARAHRGDDVLNPHLPGDRPAEREKGGENNVGYLKDIYGLKILPTREGTCPECGVNHDLEQPHNRDSLAYQYNFFDKNGRWPTWVDAMAHCAEKIKIMWIEKLQERGIEVGD